MWPFSRSAESALGPRGERLARRFLKRRGLKILGRNYRCPGGEIDLIALDSSTRSEQGAETIVFVEVKTRSSDRYTYPESAVNADKKRRIRKAASYYVGTHDTGGFITRFDIVSIVADEGGEVRIRHLPDAF